MKAAAEWVSLVGILYWLTPFVGAVVQGNPQYSWWGLSVFLSSVAAELIKLWTQALPYTCLKRPEGAAGCNAIGSDGDQSGAPGFPSGHVATASAFWMGAWLLTPPPWRLWVAGTGVLATGLMAWSRIAKRCHTGTQVLAGGVLGALVAYGLLR